MLWRCFWDAKETSSPCFDGITQLSFIARGLTVKGSGRGKKTKSRPLVSNIKSLSACISLHSGTGKRWPWASARGKTWHHGRNTRRHFKLVSTQTYNSHLKHVWNNQLTAQHSKTVNVSVFSFRTFEMSPLKGVRTFSPGSFEHCITLLPRLSRWARWATNSFLFLLIKLLQRNKTEPTSWSSVARKHQESQWRLARLISVRRRKRAISFF